MSTGSFKGLTLSAVNAAPAPLDASQPLEFNLDNYAGGGWSLKPILTLDGVVAQIDSGTTIKTKADTITYSFTELDHLTGLYNNPKQEFTAGAGFSPFSEAQRDAARKAITLWDDLIAPSFRELNGLGADIQFGNSSDPAQAYAFLPEKQGFKYQSDVFVADPAINPTNGWLGLSGAGMTTLIHELGHSIGMGHPSDYDTGPGISQDYATQADYAQDSTQYTVMSYWNAENTAAYTIDWNTLLFSNPQTPMLHDILTVQAKYGADPDTRADDTVYGFNSTAGNEVFDFSANPFPYLSIYDAGGNDTIDLSGFDASVFLDLHAGSFSSAAQAVPDAATINANLDALEAIVGPAPEFPQDFIDFIADSYKAYNASIVELDTGVSGVNATESMNISIAYGTVIENGIGGSQRDVIWGNEANNVLKGMAGDDVINGFEGDDIIDGGEGVDYLYGGPGTDTFEFTTFDPVDAIFDFEAMETIDLTGTGVDFTWIGSDAFSGTAGELRYAGGLLQGDIDGNGISDLNVYVFGAPVMESNLVII